MVKKIKCIYPNNKLSKWNVVFAMNTLTKFKIQESCWIFFLLLLYFLFRFIFFSQYQRQKNFELACIFCLFADSWRRSRVLLIFKKLVYTRSSPETFKPRNGFYFVAWCRWRSNGSINLFIPTNSYPLNARMLLQCSRFHVCRSCIQSFYFMFGEHTVLHWSFLAQFILHIQ